jgi:hypothetical protein
MAVYFNLAYNYGTLALAAASKLIVVWTRFKTPPLYEDQ